MQNGFTFDRKEAAGFNRIEILVVFTIFITIVIVFLNFVFDIQKATRDSKRKGDIESIVKQLEIHFNRTSDQFCKDAGVDSYCQIQAQWFPEEKIPVDPLTGQAYLNLPKTGDKKFMVCAKLEKDSNPVGTQMSPPGANSGVYYCSNSQQ